MVEWQSKRKRAGRDVEIAMSGVPTLPNPAIHFLPSRRPPDYAPLDTLNLTIGRTNFLRVTCHLPSNPMAFELILVSSRWDRKYRKFNIELWILWIFECLICNLYISRRNDENLSGYISYSFHLITYFPFAVVSATFHLVRLYSFSGHVSRLCTRLNSSRNISERPLNVYHY